MDSRSSLAGRRSAPVSSARLTSSVSNRSSLTDEVDLTVRHGSSADGASSVDVTGGKGGKDGLTGSASTGASRAVSASWIAESAASVGSVIFFGVFAMSVVASYYAGTEQRPDPGRATSAFSLEIPSGTPRAAGRNAPLRHFTAVRLSYRLGIPKETAR